MRFVIILLITLGIIFYFLGRSTPQQAAPPAAPVASAPVTAEPAATPTPSANPNDASGGSDLPPTPAVNHPALARMQDAARGVGVELRRFVPQPPNSAMVGIAWTGDSAARGGDFLEELVRQGIIRDFDVENKREGMAMENGRRVFTAQYLVTF